MKASSGIKLVKLKLESKDQLLARVGIGYSLSYFSLAC
jgi:hypothetical protein